MSRGAALVESLQRRAPADEPSGEEHGERLGRADALARADAGLRRLIEKGLRS
jgi:hypothetical protein